jgi:hypothetical protein
MFTGIFFSIFSLAPVVLCAFYLKNNKNRNINLKNKTKSVMITLENSKPDHLREEVINELSRQRLVFAPEEGRWVRRRQIN